MWVGAGITSLLFEIGKFFIGLYLGKSEVGVAYGAAGSLVVILIWVYYASQVFLFGAEFTAVYAEYRVTRLDPSPKKEYPMQMVLMTFRTSLEDELLKWLKAERLSFTFVEKARGKGETGQDLDIIYGDGTNTMLFAGIPDEQLTGFRDRAYNLNRELTRDGKVPLPFHIFVLPCIQWF